MAPKPDVKLLIKVTTDQLASVNMQIKHLTTMQKTLQAQLGALKAVDAARDEIKAKKMAQEVMVKASQMQKVHTASKKMQDAIVSKAKTSDKLHKLMSDFLKG